MPFIRKPDGTLLMESEDIIDWLEEVYPDRPSAYLPEAKLPVDRDSAEYKEAKSGKKTEELKELILKARPAVFALCECPRCSLASIKY